NRDILENMSEILELAGYQVFTAADGKEGLKSAARHHPDLIVSDIMMPVLDGFGLLHLIQKNPELADIPFIFLTAKTERADFRKEMEMGEDDYITKPLSDTELLNAIESRLKKTERKKKWMAGIDEGLFSANSHFAIRDLFSRRAVNKYRKKQV